MIKTFRSRALAELWSKGQTAKIDTRPHKRILIRLDRLNVVSAAEQMNLPGFDFHALRGFVPVRYTVHVKRAMVHHLRVRRSRRFPGRFEQYH